MKKIPYIVAILFCILGTINLATSQSGHLQPWQIWSNPSSSPAPAQGASLSALIDGGIPCSAPGSIIFRGSSTWGCVALGTVTSGLNVLASSLLATAAVLPNTPTYANGTLGVGATLTAASNTTLTVDGTSAPINTVVLVKNQASSFQNGVYTVTQTGSGSVPWILTRATYFDQAAEMKAGSYTFITGGTSNLNSAWVLQTAVTTVGTDPLNWAFFSSVGVASLGGTQGVITLGNCLSVPGNTLTLCLGVDTNTLRSTASGPDTILNTDCGKTVQEGTGSSGFWAVTLPSVSGFDAACQVTVVNGDTGRGKKLTGFPTNMTSPGMLWPSQQVRLKIVNGAWVAENPGRWKVPNNTTVFMDVINGADTNDCLAAGSGNACATFQQAIRTNIKDYYDLSGSSSFPTANITVQLADNGTAGACTTCYALAHIAFNPVGAEGRGNLVIKGNASNPGNVIISDASANNMGVFGNINVELANLQIGQSSCGASPKANSGIVASDGANIRVEGGVILGCQTAQQIFLGPHGYFALDGGMTVTGGGTNLVQLSENAVAEFNGKTVTCTGTTGYSQQTVTAQYNSSVTLSGVTWSGCGSVTGTRYSASGLSIIDTATGTPNSIIPGNANGSVSLGGVAN